MKPGYKTTEFWLTVAAVVGGLVLASGGFEPESCAASWCSGALAIVGFVVTALGALGYTWNRSKLKAAERFAGAAAKEETEPNPS